MSCGGALYRLAKTIGDDKRRARLQRIRSTRNYRSKSARSARIGQRRSIATEARSVALHGYSSALLRKEAIAAGRMDPVRPEEEQEEKEEGVGAKPHIARGELEAELNALALESRELEA